MKFNSLEDIYSGGIIRWYSEEAQRELHTCSVCNKEYKTSTAALKHIEKQDCHTYKEIFKDTPTENVIREIANVLMTITGSRFYSSNKKVRQSRIYNQIAKFVIYCNTSSINDYKRYLKYCVEELRYKNLNGLMAEAVKEITTKEYYEWRRSHPDYEAMDKFFDMHRIDICLNANFTIRNIEKGNLNATFLVKKIDLPNFVDNLNDVQVERLRRLL